MAEVPQVAQRVGSSGDSRRPASSQWCHLTAFSAEPRWLLPGSDLGLGMPCCEEETDASLVLWGRVHQKPRENPCCFSRLQVKSQTLMCPSAGEEASSLQVLASFCSAAMVVGNRDTASQAELSWEACEAKNVALWIKSFCSKWCC